MAGNGICKIRKGLSTTMNPVFSLRHHLVVMAIALSLQHISFSAYADDNSIYQQAWQLVSLNNSSAQAPTKPYFLFTQDGKMYGYGTCNYFSGKFKSSSNGEFLITQLNRSNQNCDGNEDIEVKLMASILMSNRFQIENGQLQLLSEQSPTVTFEPKNDVNKTELIKQASQSNSHKKAQPIGQKNGHDKHGKKVKKAAIAKSASKTKAETKKVKTSVSTIAGSSKAKKPNMTNKGKKS